MMKRKLLCSLVLLTVSVASARAQWVVSDPTNLVQSIINSVNEIAQGVESTAELAKNFEQTKKLYDECKSYYDRLKQVNEHIRGAKKVAECVAMVGDIADIYVSAYRSMLSDDNYSVAELCAMASGYAQLLERGTTIVLELRSVVSSSTMSMTDKERLDVVDKCYYGISRLKSLTAYYTRKNISISYLRSRSSGDLSRIATLYGSQNERYW